MAYYAWRSTATRRALALLTPQELERYEQAEGFLADFPHPIPGSALSTPTRFFGRDGYMLRPPDAPFMVFYTVDDSAQEFTVLLLLKAYAEP